MVNPGGIRRSLSLRPRKMVLVKSSILTEEFRVSCMIHHSITKAKGATQYWAMVPLTEEEALNVGGIALIFPQEAKIVEAEQINREAIHLSEP